LTWRRLHLWILGLYPAAWRDRYGQETAMVIDDLLSDAHRKRGRLALNLLWGMAKERVRPTVAKSGVPSQVPLAYSAPSLMRHRDLLGRRTSNESALALLEPDEQVVATFDAVTNHPQIRLLSLSWMGVAVGWVLISLFQGVSSVGLVKGAIEVAGVFAVLAVVGLIFCRLTHARSVMYILTTQGLVTCALDWWNRPHSVIGRSVAVAPEVIERHRIWRKTAFGERVVWVHRSADPVILWAKGAIA
jgi:hypothetical protein